MSDYRGAAFPISPMTGAQSGDSVPPSEAALRALQEQRAEIAQRIGEHLYRMIMGGLLHDPAVIAACRPLYEMEQRILQMELVLGTSGANASPLTRAAPPAIPASPVPVQDREEMDTAIMPGRQPAGQSGSPASVSSGERADNAPNTTHHVHGMHVSEDRVCGHCRMPLKATDRACPVCGRDTRDAVSLAATPAQASQCVRCGTTLRPQDHICPVCGTARTQ